MVLSTSVEVSVKVTVSGATPLMGAAEKLATGGSLMLFTVMVTVAVLEIPPRLSVAVYVKVSEPLKSPLGV